MWSSLLTVKMAALGTLVSLVMVILVEAGEIETKSRDDGREERVWKSRITACRLRSLLFSVEEEKGLESGGSIHGWHDVTRTVAVTT